MNKILLADANVDRSVTIFSCLELDGFIVELATDGKIASSALDRTEYDIVLVDLGLEDVPGETICSKYRERGGKGPIVVLIDEENEAMVRGSISKVNADGYLASSFDESKILSEVRRFLSTGPSGESKGKPEAGPLLEQIPLDGDRGELGAPTVIRINKGKPVLISGLRAKSIGEVLQQLQLALSAAGCSMQNLAELRVFSTNLDANEDEILSILGSLFEAHRPALTLLESARLLGDAEIELSALAYSED